MLLTPNSSLPWGLRSKKPHRYKPGGEKQYKDYEKNPLLLGSHDQLAFVIKVAVNIICSVINMHGASNRANRDGRGFSLVMGSSLCASGMRLSAFRMCHFTLF